MKEPEFKRFERVQGIYPAPAPEPPHLATPPLLPPVEEDPLSTSAEASSPILHKANITIESEDCQTEQQHEPAEVLAPPKVVRRLLFPAAAKKKNPRARRSKTLRSGLVLSVARVHARMKRDRYAKTVRETASVYLAATLEYLVAEVLELAGNCARHFKKKRIYPRHICLTLLHDRELQELTTGCIVPAGGVRPHIHSELLPCRSSNSNYLMHGFNSTVAEHAPAPAQPVG